MRLKQRQSRLMMIQSSQEATNTHLFLLFHSEFYRTVAFCAAKSKETYRYRPGTFIRYHVNNKLSIKKAD